MHPTIEIPALGIALRSSTLLVQSALLFFFTVGAWWAARRERLPFVKLVGACLVLGVVGLAGARLHFVINQPLFYAPKPWLAFNVFSGGYHIGGGVLLFGLALPFVARRAGLPAGRLADAITAPLGVGIALTRLGCFLEGCCFGTPCTYGWCLAFPPTSDAFQVQQAIGLLPAGATQSLTVHPLQLYFVGWGLLVTLVSVVMTRRKAYDGQVALVALLVWAIGQAVLEFYRFDQAQRPYWGPLPQLEWTALATAGLLLAGLVAAQLRHRRAIAAEAAR